MDVMVLLDCVTSILRHIRNLQQLLGKRVLPDQNHIDSKVNSNFRNIKTVRSGKTRRSCLCLRIRKNGVLLQVLTHLPEDEAL